MKHFFTTLIAFCFSLIAFSQAPQGFNYQAVIRDANGDIMANANVTLKFTITTWVLTTIKYQETQALETNEFGLLNTVIGYGTVLQGSMTTVAWHEGGRFLKVEVDAGSGYVNMGIQQMMSVPYAMSSLNATNAWGTSGNEGTSPTDNFIGTTDDTPLAFRVNNESAGLIDNSTGSLFLGMQSGAENEANSNTFIGNYSGASNTIGFDNNAFGASALFNNTTGLENIAIGKNAGYANESGNSNIYIGNNAAVDFEDSSNNTVIGHNAMNGNFSDGDENVAIGNGALRQGGFQKVAIGFEAGLSANDYYTSGDIMIGYRAGYDSGYDYDYGGSSVLIGYEAGYYNPGGSSNVFIGAQAGYSNDGPASSSLGVDNTYIGYMAGFGDLNTAYDGSDNTFVGSRAGYSITSGDDNSFFGRATGDENTTGSWNTFLGSYAGSSNTDASYNTFVGYAAGIFNEGGAKNTFMGYFAGRLNHSGYYNTFIGNEAGHGNDNGYDNTYVGHQSGLANTSGNENTFYGSQSGHVNTTGDENTFIGRNAGVNNSTADHNTAIGFDAGGSQTTGGDCTFLGYSAEGSTGTITNSTAIGYQASVIGSNHVRIGNTSITQIGGQVAWSNLSDARLKKNIAPSTLGLEFIKKLKPVTYNFIDGHEGILYTGFLAQDVEKTLNEMGEDFSGITKPENETDFYSIRYAEFVMPLVNAVKELSAENESLKSTLSDMQVSMNAQQKQIDSLLSNQTSK